MMIPERVVASRIALELAVVMERQSGAYRSLAKLLSADSYDDCARDLTAINKDHRLAIRLASAMRELYDPQITSPAFETERAVQGSAAPSSSVTPDQETRDG